MPRSTRGPYVNLLRRQPLRYATRNCQTEDLNAQDVNLPPSRLLPTRSHTPPVDHSRHRKRRTAARFWINVGTKENGKDISEYTGPLEGKEIGEYTEPLEERPDGAVVTPSPSTELLSENETCPCTATTTPLPPQYWPQYPLLLRPSRGTTVIGIRLCHSKEYLWKPGDPGCWYSALWKSQEFSNINQHPSSSTGALYEKNSNYSSCGKCCSLPINNGNETEALVTDFVTPLFQGTLLVRIRDSQGTTTHNNSNNNTGNKKGYFSGVNRRYQAVIQGRFLEPINLLVCRTGFQLERPSGKLPPKWIIKSGLKVLNFFAPQLQVFLDSESPSYALMPLGSNPQCIIVGDHDISIDKVLQEPSSNRHCLLDTTSGRTSKQRARFRKKQWDKLYQDNNAAPIRADTSTVYVFEFLQHLFDFQNLLLDLGSLGSVSLEGILNGQPLNILALHESTPLWSFDLWHEQLYKVAVAYNDGLG